MICDGRVYTEKNPLDLMTPHETTLFRLWHFCYARSELGGGHYAHFPDGRGVGFQPAILMDAFAVIEAKVSALKKANRPKRPGT